MSEASGVAASDAVTDSDAVTNKVARTLRAIFPHDGLGDGPYLRSAEAIVQAAAGSPRQMSLIVEGIRSLEGLVGGDLGSADVDTVGRLLRHLEQTEFFQTLLTSSVVTLYSDEETWSHLGYEGFSTDKGGYIHRGFDDIDWLPAPRIEEYQGDEGLVDYTPEVPGSTPDFTTTSRRGDAR